MSYIIYLEKLNEESVECVGLKTHTQRRYHKFSIFSFLNHRHHLKLRDVGVTWLLPTGPRWPGRTGDVHLRFYSSSFAWRRTKRCNDSRSLPPLCSLTFLPPRKNNNVG